MFSFVASLYVAEISRARGRVTELRERFPEASTTELAQRLIDGKVTWAASGGAVGGIFGAAVLPAELAFVGYLQFALILEIALLYGHNLKSRRAQGEIVALLSDLHGLNAPRLLSRYARRALWRRGAELLGRAVPFAASPISAHLNNRDLRRAGREAIRLYETMARLPRRATV